MANRPNCNIPPLVSYSGHIYCWKKAHEFGKWTCFFSSFPLFLFFYPNQYSNISSLTVSTRVHLDIYIIKETKTTDVFFKFRSKVLKHVYCFACFYVVERWRNVQSRHCFFRLCFFGADLQQTCQRNAILGQSV